MPTKVTITRVFIRTIRHLGRKRGLRKVCYAEIKVECDKVQCEGCRHHRSWKRTTMIPRWLYERLKEKRGL